MSSLSSDYESSSYTEYTESEAESDSVWNEEYRTTIHVNHTAEVEDIIREHVDITATNAIRLNQHYKTKLIMLRVELEGMLFRCKNHLRDVEKNLDNIRNNLTPQKCRLLRQPRHPGYICGQPFFKDHELYPGPHNEDYLYRKNVKKEFFPLDMFESTETLWTSRDKQSLQKAVWSQAAEFLQRESDLQMKMCNDSTRMAAIIKDRTTLKGLSLQQIWCMAKAYDDGKYGRQQFTVDWMKISNTVIHGRHTASSCEGMWNNYLMPSLRKTMWRTDEEEKLVAAARTHKCQRWDLIAQSVGQRSEYQCFVHYQTNYSELSQTKKMPWTAEEDELLLKLTEENRVGNNIIWNKIVERMPYRNKVQVYHRYKYTLLRPLRGAKFTAEEDCVITAYVQQYGDDFKFFPDELLPGRTTKQVWSRYKNTLQFVNTHVGWSLEEDRRLMGYIAQNLTEEGPQRISWADCAKHLGNHSRLSCRTRYYTIEKFLEKHPNATLENVPRREKKKLSSKVTDKNWIKTIVDIKSAPKIVRKLGVSANFFESFKSSAIEWGLYEQMKFCFRYKFGYKLTVVESRQKHVFKGTKILLHLLEGFRTDTKLQPNTYALSVIDETAMRAVLQVSLNWPVLIKNVQSWELVTRDRTAFACRIPPNYNTVLGLRGVCLNACYGLTKHFTIDPKNKKLNKFDEILYDQSMALFVERFRKIFHWTMLLMMLNIDDVAFESEQQYDGDGTTSNKDRDSLTVLHSNECTPTRAINSKHKDIVTPKERISQVKAHSKSKDVVATVTETSSLSTIISTKPNTAFINQLHSCALHGTVQSAPLANDPLISQFNKASDVIGVQCTKGNRKHAPADSNISYHITENNVSYTVVTCALPESNTKDIDASLHDDADPSFPCAKGTEHASRVLELQQRKKENSCFVEKDSNQLIREKTTIPPQQSIGKRESAKHIEYEQFPQHNPGRLLNPIQYDSIFLLNNATDEQEHECKDDANDTFFMSEVLEPIQSDQESSIVSNKVMTCKIDDLSRSSLRWSVDERMESGTGTILPAVKMEQFNELLTNIDESFTAVDIIRMLRTQYTDEQGACSDESEHDQI